MKKPLVLSYAYCIHNPLRYVDPTGWPSGIQKSKSGRIQDYLSDPCYITRQQLKEGGMYNIEGGYGWAGGQGSMSAGWMEGDGYQCSRIRCFANRILQDAVHCFYRIQIDSSNP